DELFARAAFSGDEHTSLGAPDLGDLQQESHHGFALTDELALNAATQVPQGLVCGELAKRIANADDDAIAGKGLLEEVERAQACGSDRVVHGGMSADHDDGDARS